MEREGPIIHPDALHMKFGERTENYRTWKQFRCLAKNMEDAKIRYHHPDSTIEESGPLIHWEAYMKIMNTVIAPRAELAPNGKLTLTLNFADADTANRFSSFNQKLFKGSTGLEFLPGEALDQVKILNFGHEDLCTWGRVGTALFIRDYESRTPVKTTNLQGEKQQILEENTRLLVQRSIKRIEEVSDYSEKKFEQLLPAEVRELLRQQSDMRDLLRQQSEDLGREADNSLLTSGIGISLIGMEIRRELKKRRKPLYMQRKWGNRPDIEARINFYHRKGKNVGNRPVSGLTQRQELQDSFIDQVKNLMKPVKDRDAAAIVGQSVDIVGGLIENSVTLGTRIIDTGFRAPLVVTGGIMADRWRKREQDGIRNRILPVIGKNKP